MPSSTCSYYVEPLQEKGKGNCFNGLLFEAVSANAKLYNEGWVEKIVYVLASHYGIDLGIGLSEGNKVHKMLTFLKIPEKIYFLKDTRNTSTSKKRSSLKNH